MEKEDQDKTTSPIQGKVTIRYVHPDGRANALITWPNGFWKVEVFATAQHAEQFAVDNDMEGEYLAHDNE